MGRAELRAAAAPVVAEAGLRWEPEGLGGAWRAEVCAAGELDGAPVRLRWRRAWGRVRAELWVGAGWAVIPATGGLAAIRAARA